MRSTTPSDLGDVEAWLSKVPDLLIVHQKVEGLLSIQGRCRSSLTAPRISAGIDRFEERRVRFAFEEKVSETPKVPQCSLTGCLVFLASVKLDGAVDLTSTQVV